MEKELKIIPPKGYEIDQECSTLDCIKFKPVAKRWRDNKNTTIRGFYIDTDSSIYGHEGANNTHNYNLFVTDKQAKSALAMARISQIMANDPRFGGVVTDEEQANENIWKYSINRNGNKIETYYGTNGIDHFLSFHSEKQCDLFLEENEDLIKEYLMIE